MTPLSDGDNQVKLSNGCALVKNFYGLVRRASTAVELDVGGRKGRGKSRMAVRPA